MSRLYNILAAIISKPYMTAAGTSDMSLTTSYKKQPLSAYASGGTGISLSDNGIVVSEAGKYEVAASCYFENTNDSNVCNLRIAKNGDSSNGIVQQTNRSIGDRCGLTIAPCVVSLNANDSVQLYACNSSTAAGTTRAGSAEKRTWLTVTKLGGGTA